MDVVSRSPALNPASTPFFPGGGLMREEDRGSDVAFRLPTTREQYSSSASTLSISPSDYRSVKSSPSPSHEDRDGSLDNHYQGDGSRQSPMIHQVDADRGFPIIFKPPMKESSMSAVLETIPDEDTVNGFQGLVHGNNSLLSNALYTTVMGRGRDRLNTPPVLTEVNGRSGSFNNGPRLSTSPSSSLDSTTSMLASGVDLAANFEAQLKRSPLVNEILDRLGRAEFTAREIQRDLSDVHRKVDLLLERSISSNSPPEFRDPFAPSTTNPSFSGPGLNGPRGSIIGNIGNIAPNQAAPSDDITTISHRINSLTTSVDQLLAISTQQLQVNNSGLPNVMGPTSQSRDLLASQMLAPSLAPTNTLGHGMPNRTELRSNSRGSNPPVRTWSVGNIDIAPRASESGPGGLARPDTMFRDKRRSVSGLLRRDSAGGESLAGSIAGSRDGGPMITKWEQLTIAPELLRSLNSFGVGPPNKIQQRALPFLLKGADIIAQAPPTQERIAAYVIPAIHIALTNSSGRGPLRGPIVIMISTTVDQATQAQRMIRDIGGPIGIRSALGVGSSNGDLSQELRLLQQNMPHIICGTPQKLHALFAANAGMSASEVRFLVLDEVDQLIARNLHDFVYNIVKILPPPRSRPLTGTPTTPGTASQSSFTNFDNNSSASLAPSLQNSSRRFSTVSPAPSTDSNSGSANSPVERQTALFSNTVPQDVLNLATTIQLREPVRVLVRRDGNVTHADTNQGARGLRQFYLYLAFTAGGGRSDASTPMTGLGIIGSGRGASSAETAQAREWKLEALVDLFDDLDLPQAIIHVGGITALDAVAYKLANRGLDVVPLHGDMNAGAKLAALNKFRSPPSGLMRQSPMKILVVYDVQVKTPEISQVPLIINYDLPKAVEEYAHRVAPAIAPSYSRAGVIVNFVTATGGDVEMLRSIECFYKIKCPEVPSSLRDIV